MRKHPYDQLKDAYDKFIREACIRGYAVPVQVKIADTRILKWANRAAGWGLYLQRSFSNGDAADVVPISQASVDDRLLAARYLSALVTAMNSAREGQFSEVVSAAVKVKMAAELLRDMESYE